MKIKESIWRRIFLVCNIIFLLIVGVCCLLPFVHMLAVSLSDKMPVSQNKVVFWPVDFTFKSYEFITQSNTFMNSLFNSVKRVGLGLGVNLLLIELTAYPLSHEKEQFRARSIYAWFFIITILFNGGMVPTYMVVRYTGLLDTLGALVLPGAIPVFSMLVVMNFFRQLPKELQEAALIDGASHVDTLFRIILPVSLPALATVSLFSIVNHWNAWFDGLLYMNRETNYPLQTYLQTVIINPEHFFRNTTNLSSQAQSIVNAINVRTTKSAQLFLATIPVLVVYPFLQKYFTTGLVMGSVKG